jgi:hypothetical protein
MKWLIAEYHPVTLFSLRLGEATSTGAKTLLVPTPFAIRTALLDAAIRTQGVATGPTAFEAIKGLRLAMRPSERVVVTSLFAKVLKPQRSDKPGRKKGAMQPTIAFREYAHLEGGLGLALGSDEAALMAVELLLAQVNYFGKRGSFFQLLAPPGPVETADDTSPPGFIPLEGVYVNEGRITGQGPQTFPLGLVQLMDDWGPGLTYDKVNVYDPAKIRRPGKGDDRIRRGVVFPYRLTRTGRGFTAYECV